MKRRDFLKYGSAGIAGVALGGLTKMPLVRIGNVFAESSGAWKFGVMGDTQWTIHGADPSNPTMTDYSTDPAGQSDPYSVAASIINQIDPMFVQQGVQFVIQVGDLTDCGTTRAIQARSNIARTNLTANGIDFFPVRGNHETYGYEYGDTATDFGVAAMQNAFPQMAGSEIVSSATNFVPSSVASDCISYSFDCNNARFLMLDFWCNGTKNTAAAGYNFGYDVNTQQAWITEQLSSRSSGAHAFVITHQPLMAEDHQDTIFTGYTNANPLWQNAFYSSLQGNNVGYYISGHDHMHQRSIIASPDGNSHVQELICASCSSKFYTPVASLTNSNWFGQKGRETSISQELYTVGYYIFTVDGPLVTVDYYSSAPLAPTPVNPATNSSAISDGNYPGTANGSNLVTPSFTFTKQETWGYSLNGAQYTILEGSGYTTTQISFTDPTTGNSTTAGITKNSAVMDYNGRYLTKTVDAYYADRTTVTNAYAISDVLALVGVMNLGSDTYGITMSYDPTVALSRTDINNGRMISVNSQDHNGNWVNAVNFNNGGHSRFIYGPFNKAYPVGTYGVDTTNHIAWAIVNYDGDFTNFAVIGTGY
jgi:hypothetical protein